MVPFAAQAALPSRPKLGPEAASVRWYRAASGGSSFNTGNYTTPTLTTTTTYYINSVNTSTSNCESDRIPVVVPVAPGPATPVTNTAPTVCSGPVTLTAAPGSGADAVRWTGSGGTQSGNNYTIANLTANATYSVASVNSTSGCASTSIPVNVKVNTRPIALTSAYSTTVRGHGQVQLTGRLPGSTIDWDSIYWYTTASGGTPESKVSYFDAYTTPDLNAPISYYGAHVDGATGCESLTRLQVTAGILPLMSPNQVREDNIRVRGINTETKLNALTDAQKISTVSHYDGLGRVNQQIAVKASPLGYDIVQPIEFDTKGRMSKNYLPYVAQNQANNGSFQSNYKTDQATFYTTPPTGMQSDAAPYAVNLYEESPLARPLEQGRAGSVFQPGTGHTLRTTYSFNAANEVRKFSTDGTSTQFYDANKLNKVTFTDPNGRTSIQFTNAEGQVILARHQWDETVGGTTIDYLDTYYIYDDLGKIKYIISPKGVTTLKTTSWNLTQDILSGYTYQFVYDDLGRVIEKKVPGQDWLYLIYDRLDRLALFQYGSMRVQNKWSYLKYDQNERVIMQGWYTNTEYTSRADIQKYVVDPLYANVTDVWYESPGTTLHGYTNNSFPATNAEAQTVNYFDSYDIDRNGTDDFSYTSQNLGNENTPGSATGRATATKRIIPNTNTWLTTYMFYDEYGKPIQQRSNNHLNPTAFNDYITQVYDFDGILKKALFQQDVGSSGILTIYNEFDYDAAGRISEIRQKNNNTGNLQTIAHYSYDELGRLIDKKTS